MLILLFQPPVYALCYYYYYNLFFFRKRLFLVLDVVKINFSKRALTFQCNF